MAAWSFLTTSTLCAARTASLDGAQPRRLACELPPVEENHRLADGQFLGYLTDRCYRSGWQPVEQVIADARLGHSGGGATTLRHYADPVPEADRIGAAYLAQLIAGSGAKATDASKTAVVPLDA